MIDRSEQNWNPLDDAVLADQRQAYDDLRERCPVAHSDTMHWSLFRHADVVKVLDDPDTFINASRHHAIPNSMNGMDHREHRNVLEDHFSASGMAAIEPNCRQIATEVMQALRGSETSDAVANIAEPIALRTMCAFLGWNERTWERVRDWIHGNREATARRDREAGRALAAEYAAIVTEEVEDHRHRNVTHDVTAKLMMTKVSGHRWNDDYMIATLRNWIAGHGTVVSAIGIAIAYLAEDQELQARLRDNPELIPATIEEILRADGPLVANMRTTTREATIHGRTIPEGERISLMWIAANRDPKAFDSPDEFKLERNQDGNLLYGAGIHYCLGAPLARLEMQVTIETLLAHTSGFALASSEPLERETNPANGFPAVPIRIV